jgi:hypothetical protein
VRASVDLGLLEELATVDGHLLADLFHLFLIVRVVEWSVLSEGFHVLQNGFERLRQ